MRRSLGRLERASAEEVVAYQERRLRLLVRWAAVGSPFYREWFAESGVEPGDIRTLGDLQRLPLENPANTAPAPTHASAQIRSGPHAQRLTPQSDERSRLGPVRPCLDVLGG